MNTEENITTKEDESTEKNTCGCTDERVSTEEGTEENITTREDESTEKNTCGCAGEQVCTEEGTLVEEEEDRDVINDIIKIFEDTSCAYPLDDVIAELKELGYENPGGVITLALQDDVIYVDSVEDSGMVYLAVSNQSEEE